MLKKTLMGLCAILAAACAGPETNTQADSQDRGEVVTGSNIPRKKGQAPMGVERASPADLQRSRDAAGGTSPSGAR